MDVAQLLGFLAVAAWIGRLRQLEVSPPPLEVNYLAFATVKKPNNCTAAADLASLFRRGI